MNTLLSLSGNVYSTLGIGSIIGAIYSINLSTKLSKNNSHNSWTPQKKALISGIVLTSFLSGGISLCISKTHTDDMDKTIAYLASLSDNDLELVANKMINNSQNELLKERIEIINQAKFDNSIDKDDLLTLEQDVLVDYLKQLSLEDFYQEHELIGSDNITEYQEKKENDSAIELRKKMNLNSSKII